MSCTAKILWLPKPNSNAEARPRWVRCTPLLGSDSQIGVWMIIVVPIGQSQELLEQPSTNQLAAERSSSRQSRISMKSSARSQSIDDLEQNHYHSTHTPHTPHTPIRTASILDMRPRMGRPGMAIRVPNGTEPALRSPMISPLSEGDSDLYADYMKHPGGPLPIPPPKSTRDGDTSPTASFFSHSQLQL